ncbi:MAG: HEAT repeat domain-containing protein [Acidimicrobiales bacterium]
MASTAPAPPEGPGPLEIVERRRAVALAGHTDDIDGVRRGLTDPAPAVRATAWSALARLGMLDPTGVRTALADHAAEVRTRACELAARPFPPGKGGEEIAPQRDGQEIHRGVVDRLCQAVHDESATVAEAACFALGELGAADSSGAAVPTLVGAAGGHADPLVREAAVAALGAIGDPSGLPAILAATSDKPAVRRRAVLALAPFDGPDVDTALQRALTDRDWQVRQAAEDMTGT